MSKKTFTVVSWKQDTGNMDDAQIAIKAYLPGVYSEEEVGAEVDDVLGVLLKTEPAQYTVTKFVHEGDETDG